MKRLLIAALLLPMLALAQEKGIQFEHGMSWNDIQAKAKAENKYIFMDCFTTWCGPCKWMTKEIFPQETVGAYMNDKFISVKVQMDRTDKDEDAVKKWYDDAKMIEKKYGIAAYPTFLFFSPDGKMVDRHVGGGDAPAFIAVCKNALNPEKQYYPQLEAFEKGRKDPDFVRKLALLSLDKYDMENARKLSKAYLSQQKDPYTAENIKFIEPFTSSSKDEGFNIFLHHADKVDKVLGEGAANKKIIAIVTREEVFSKFRNNPDAVPDWTAIEKNLKTKYPKVAEEALLMAKIRYFSYKKDSKNTVDNIVAYMQKFGRNASPEELNEYAWTIFEVCNDQKCIEQALEWSKRSFKDKPDPMFMDTYANLLYKSGKKADAITWEEKAMQLAPEKTRQTFAETLDKMKKGE